MDYDLHTFFFFGLAVTEKGKGVVAGDDGLNVEFPQSFFFFNVLERIIECGL